MEPAERPDPSSAAPSRGWARWTAAGFEFGAAVLLFFLLGRWLDATWATSPWLTAVGTFTGVAVGTYLLIRQALAAEKRDRGRSGE